MLLVRIEHEPQFVMYLSIFVVQLLNCVRLFVTPWAAARQASWDLHYLLEFAQTCPLSQWCQPPKSSSVVLFSCCLQSCPSGTFPVSQFFCIRWANDWSFRFSISPSNEYSRLISWVYPKKFDLPMDDLLVEVSFFKDIFWGRSCDR